jgi:hypothetical protein
MMGKYNGTLNVTGTVLGCTVLGLGFSSIGWIASERSLQAVM